MDASLSAQRYAGIFHGADYAIDVHKGGCYNLGRKDMVSRHTKTPESGSFTGGFFVGLVAPRNVYLTTCKGNTRLRLPQ